MCVCRLMHTRILLWKLYDWLIGSWTERAGTKIAPKKRKKTTNSHLDKSFLDSKYVFTSTVRAATKSGKRNLSPSSSAFFIFGPEFQLDAFRLTLEHDPLVLYKHVCARTRMQPRPRRQMYKCEWKTGRVDVAAVANRYKNIRHCEGRLNS